MSQITAEILKQNPMGHQNDTGNDIGPAADFLASDDSRYLAGNTLFVAGGHHVSGINQMPKLPDDFGN